MSDTSNPGALNSETINNEQERASPAIADPPKGNEASQPGFVGYLFWAAIVVGLILVVLGTEIFNSIRLSGAASQLILCSGLGIILGAFGSTATVRHKAAVLTGVAAIAVVLIYVTSYIFGGQWTQGLITGNLQNAVIEIRGDQTYLIARDGSEHRFIVPGERLKRSSFDVLATFHNPDTGTQDDISFRRIGRIHLETYMGTGETIEWAIEETNLGYNLIDVRTNEVIGSFGPGQIALQQVIGSTRERSMFDGRWISSIGIAHAQDVVELGENAFGVETTLHNLQSEIPSIRWEARQQIVGYGPAVVPQVLEQWRTTPENRTVETSTIVSMTEILRAYAEQLDQVQGYVLDEDLDRLLEAVNSNDRVNRIYAAELLYDLRDERIVPLALEAAARSDATDEGRYLSVLVLSNALRSVSEHEQEEAIRILNVIRTTEDTGSQTQELIDQVIDTLATQ